MNGLTFEFVRSGNELVVQCGGKLNTNTVSELTEEIEKRMDGVEKLTIDFSELAYLSSSGLRLIVELHKNMNKIGGDLVLRHLNDEVMDIFELTGLTSFMHIEN